MKKLFYAFALSALALSANAQDVVKKLHIYGKDATVNGKEVMWAIWDSPTFEPVDGK